MIGTPLTKPQRLSTSSTFTWVTAQSCSSRRSRHLFCTWFTRFSLKDGSLDISFAVNRKLEPTQVYYVLHLPTHWPTGAKNGTLDRSCAKPDTMHEFEMRYWRLQSALQTLQGPQRVRSFGTPGQDHDLYRFQVLRDSDAGLIVDGKIRYEPGESGIQRAKLQSPPRTVVVNSIFHCSHGYPSPSSSRHL